MNYYTWDLGQQSAGTVVEVTLAGNSANVKLMDSANLASYKSGRNHRYTGGHVTRSPFRVSVPGSEHWHIVIDYGGYAGSGRASVRVLSSH
ncbi:DUF1883 domain-containing protein [Amycolatopsis sp. cg5]|uniref:DUF1883 domain-containing protein n=1 Tax=Amycolatopsis sp. cg5 TaxID=3238802 RepID=UPI003524986D